MNYKQANENQALLLTLPLPQYNPFFKCKYVDVIQVPARDTRVAKIRILTNRLYLVNGSYADVLFTNLNCVFVFYDSNKLYDHE